jgi:hypothetical protein
MYGKLTMHRFYHRVPVLYQRKFFMGGLCSWSFVLCFLLAFSGLIIYKNSGFSIWELFWGSSLQDFCAMDASDC